MKFIKKQSDKILITTREEAFEIYVRRHPVISRLIHEIGMEIIQQAYYGNHVARIPIGADDKDVLNTIYQVLENDGYKHSFDIVEKVLTVNIL